MGRIRTIKPQFFKHADLYDAEIETGLPLRVAFAGLWTVCDREGRFKWKPRDIKTDVLPHDVVDFARVLDAFLTRGFVERYEVDGEAYGYVPSFNDHQSINVRESASVIPAPPTGKRKKTSKNNGSHDQSVTRDIYKSDASTTRAPRDAHAAHGEGKGSLTTSPSRSPSPATPGPGTPEGSPGRAPKPPEVAIAVFENGVRMAIEANGTPNLDWAPLEYEEPRFRGEQWIAIRDRVLASPEPITFRLNGEVVEPLRMAEVVPIRETPSAEPQGFPDIPPGLDRRTTRETSQGPPDAA